MGRVTGGGTRIEADVRMTDVDSIARFHRLRSFDALPTSRRNFTPIDRD